MHKEDWKNIDNIIEKLRTKYSELKLNRSGMYRILSGFRDMHACTVGDTFGWDSAQFRSALAKAYLENGKHLLLIKDIWHACHACMLPFNIVLCYI
jgi:hypothetical protein